MALKYHVPFIGMPYEVWQAGPVAKDVFIDLSDVPYILKGFVRTEFRDGGIFIEAIADFDDSEFSKCEIEIMDYVLVRYGNMTASDLFLETCKKDSLWYRAAVRTGLLETFNRQECNNSDLQINFAEVMSDRFGRGVLRELEYTADCKSFKCRILCLKVCLFLGAYGTI